MSLDARAKFMQVVAVIFIVFAILWGLAPYPSINLPARFIIDVLDWPLDNLVSQLDRNTMWLSAIGSGLLGAFAIFLGGVVAPAIKEADMRIIKTTIWAMVFWYIVDGAGSIASGVSSNAIINTIYLALVLVPLVGIKKKQIT
ncbi:MAG: hypothetical protein L3J52_02040 [Proteobacteria bacterium]|nr:hypothetical protein [Pseudomonadota bacterium]